MVRLETIRTKDGKKIELRVYVPDEDTTRVIIISPSAQVTQKFYYDIACFFIENKFAVITFDFRGTGESATGTLKGFKANLENWAQQDLDAVLRYAKNQFSKQELIFMGHGIGGEIVGNYSGVELARFVLAQAENFVEVRERVIRRRSKIEIRKPQANGGGLAGRDG